MKKRAKLGYFSAGMVCALLITTLAGPVLAATISKTITVTTGVTIYMDDTKLNPTDVNGSAVEPFIYNGTTYLPVRAISQAVNKNVAWDGKSYSVFLGEHTAANQPAGKLVDKDFFSSARWNVYDTSFKDNLGGWHDGKFWANTNSVGEAVYKLNGQYSKLTGTFFVGFDYRTASSANVTTLTIICDGKTVLDKAITVNDEPIPVSVDLTGVQEMKIILDNTHGSLGSLGDAVLFN